MKSLRQKAIERENQVDKAAIDSARGIKYINLDSTTRKADFFGSNRGKSFVNLREKRLEID